jgi:hypothetical protein
MVLGLLGTVLRGDRVPGRAVRPADEPEVAALVRKVADRLDFRAPLLVRVIPVADAALQPAKVSGTRAFVLVLGWPLLRYLTAAQLAAVVAHELAHQQHARDRRSAWLLAARASVTESLDSRFRAPAALIERLLRASQPRCWDLELAADVTAATVVGSAAVRDAVERTGTLEAGFGVLGECWASVLEDDGAYPEDLYDALEVALRDPHVARRVATIAAREDLLDPYTSASHPPRGRRLAALPDGVGAGWDDTRPVAVRGADAIDHWCVMELVGPDDDRHGLRPARVLDSAPERFDVPADEARSALAKATGRDSAAEAIAAAVDAVGDGTWPRLARAIDPEIGSAPAPLRATIARDVMAGCLGRAVDAALLEAGWDRASRWMTSVVVAPDGAVVDVREVLEQALDSGEVGPVRALVHAAAAGAAS